jgi:hypothetical protein
MCSRAGFPADTGAQLGAAASALEGVITERANAKVRRVGSTKGIHEELLKGREAVAMLNAVVSRQFVGDKTFLAPSTTPVVNDAATPEAQAAA